MDLVIKVGDDGYQFSITELSKDEKISSIQELIQQETKIQVQDQLLLTKKGNKLNSSDTLAVFETDASMLQTIQQIQDAKNTIFTVYVFDQSDDSQRQPNYSSINSSIEQRVKQQPEIKFLTDLRSSLSSEFSDSNKREILTNLNGNVFTYETNLYQYLMSMKPKYLAYSQKIRQFEKLSQELENQLQSFDVLLKMISMNYKFTKEKNIQAQKKGKESLERNLLTVKKFDESIENLKRIELHPALQTDSQKYLADIYYKPEAMQKWKNNCLITSNNVKNKLEKTNAYVKKMKKKIKDERNNNVQSCVSSYKNHSATFQQFIQESKPLITTLVVTTIEEYSQLREYMQTYSDNPDDETSLYFLSSYEIANEKSKQLDESLTHLSEHLEKVIKSVEVFTKLRQTNQVSLSNMFKIMRGINIEFEQINEKVKQIDDEVEKMEKDFSYLLNPTQLPQAYNYALAETSRRREFKQVFEQLYRQLVTISEMEKEKRKKFLNTFGRILPSDFIPQLKHLAPSITLSCQILDQDLPDVSGKHSESDSYRSYLDTDKKSEKLLKEIDELNELLKKTHSVYESKRDPHDKQSLSQYKELLCMTAKNSLKLVTQRWDISLDEKKSLASEVSSLHQQVFKHQELLKATQNQLLELKERYQREQEDNKQTKEKLLQVENRENKLKMEQSELSNQNKNELDKLKFRIKQLEIDFSNRQIEIEKLSQTVLQQKTELRQKQEESDQLARNFDQLNSQFSKSKDETRQYINKCENLELVLLQKNNDLNNSIKQYQVITKERQTLQDQISNLKLQQQEALKKIKLQQDSQKASDDEKAFLKLQYDKQKQQNDLMMQEIANLKNELQKSNQMVQSVKRQVDQESEQMLLLDSLQRKAQEFEKAIRSKECEIEDQQKQIQDLKIINEQMQIECQIHQAKNIELDAMNMELHEQITQNDEISREDQIRSQETMLSILEEEKDKIYNKYSDLLNQYNELEFKNNQQEKEFQGNLNKIEEKLYQKYTNEQKELQNKILGYEQEIEKLQSQIQYISTKNQQEQQNQIQFIQNRLKLIDENFLFDLSSVRVGKCNIFLPVSGGVYVPFVINKIEQLSISTMSSSVLSNQQNQQNKKMLLNTNHLPQQFKELINDTGLIIIAQVTEINSYVHQDLSKSSSFLEENEEYFDIRIENPKYMIGFEESDIRLKNFTV